MRQDIVQGALTERAAQEADAGAIADATVLLLALLHIELDALVGSQASRALYLRALHLTRPAFGWSPANADALADVQIGLHADLASRPPADARKAAESMLVALADLLISLIGDPLTQRLLRTAWAAPVTGDKTSQEKAK